MKKFTASAAIIALIAFNFSCKKEQDSTITKTFDVTLSPGQTYTTQVGGGDEDDMLKITQQAKHADVSELTANSGSRDMTFTYTPASQYIGSDQVQITNSEGEHHGHGGHGNCGGHHHDESTVYVYNITITGNNH